VIVNGKASDETANPQGEENAPPQWHSEGRERQFRIAIIIAFLVSGNDLLEEKVEESDIREGDEEGDVDDEEESADSGHEEEDDVKLFRIGILEGGEGELIDAAQDHRCHRWLEREERR